MKNNVLFTSLFIGIILLINSCGNSQTNQNQEKDSIGVISKALENSDEGTMTTNEQMILGRWVSQTVKGYEIEFKDGKRTEFQDGTEGGWMPYSVVESCENQTNDPMGAALSIKYICYKLDFVSDNEFSIQEQSPKKGEIEVYKRK